jgi:hypothetical protein
MARRVRQAMPRGRGRPISPADAVMVAEALSGNAFAVTALMLHAFPGRTRRAPGMVVGQLVIRRFVAECMADLWLLVLDMGIERAVPSTVHVHCKGDDDVFNL